MKTDTAYITPQAAKTMLANNKLNRKVNVSAVEKYARDMKAGKWQLTHQGILIGRGGRVIDGQHRLMAIVRSGCAQHMLVSHDENIESPLGVNVDVGHKRDSAFILGVSKQLAAISAFALNITTINRNPSADDLAPICELFSVPLEILTGGNKTSARGVTGSGVLLAGVTRILLGEEPEYISKTFRAMVFSKFSELSPLAASFYKQVVVDRAITDQRQLLSRAIRVFDASRADLTRSMVKDEELAFNEARALVASVMPKGVA